jgi:hypothetical protein
MVYSCFFYICMVHTVVTTMFSWVQPSYTTRQYINTNKLYGRHVSAISLSHPQASHRNVRTKNTALVYICFIQIHTGVQYSFFLKSFFLYMFRMSHAFIVRSTTVKHTKTIKKIPMAVHYSCAPDDGCM